jgi:hypothetical protein
MSEKNSDENTPRPVIKDPVARPAGNSPRHVSLRYSRKYAEHHQKSTAKTNVRRRR